MSVKPIISAAEAVKFLQDGMTFVTTGFVACQMPESTNKAIEKSFLETGHPRDLTLLYAAAQGNRDGSGADHFAHEGLLKRVIGAITFLRVRSPSSSVISPATSSAPSPMSA